MKTSALPLKKQNYNAAAFVLALCIYCPAALLGVTLFRHFGTAVIMRSEEPVVSIMMKNLPPPPVSALPAPNLPPAEVPGAEKKPEAPEIPEKTASPELSSPAPAVFSADPATPSVPAAPPKIKPSRPAANAASSPKPAVRKDNRPSVKNGKKPDKKIANRSEKRAERPAEKAPEIIPGPAPVPERPNAAAGSAGNKPAPGAGASGAPPETLVYGKTRDALMAQIVKSLRAHLYYPEQARRTGKQGVVAVSFVIGKNGGARDIRAVKAGTDSALLKDAALITVKNAAGSFPAPGREIRVIAPVEFRLR